jgi:thiamine biosynthesis protein ThiS
MMVRVRGKEHAWWEGMTVSDLLKELNDPYPYVVARINGNVISRPDFERTAIPDGAEVFLIPMIAGG